jgi:hypothetical protein
MRQNVKLGIPKEVMSLPKEEMLAYFMEKIKDIDLFPVKNAEAMRLLENSTVNGKKAFFPDKRRPK